MIAALAFLQAAAQPSPVSPPPAVAPDVASRVRFFRWQEEYADLAERRSELSGVDLLKAIPLGADAYASFGGQYRARLDAASDPDWGLRGADDFAALNHRILLHADVHTGGRVRTFLQVGYYQEVGREPGPRPPDESGVDVHQGFLDLDLSPAADGGVMLRAGRQEISLPSSRMLGQREGPNQRRAFDAVHLRINAGRASAQAFYARPVVPDQGAFADRSTGDEAFYGAWASVPFSEGGPTLGAFYLGRERADQFWYQEVADETRHTLGARLSGGAGAVRYAYEVAYQFGSFGEGDIDAWGIATETSYDVDALWSPRLTLRANAASGDDDGDDPDLGTFNALYPNLAYFTEAAVYAPTNAVDIHPRIGISPRTDFTVSAGLTAIWRLEDTDGVYGAGYSPLVAPDVSDASRTATFVDVDAVWQPTPRYRLRGTYVYGTVEEAIKDAGGEDFHYFVLVGAVTF